MSPILPDRFATCFAQRRRDPWIVRVLIEDFQEGVDDGLADTVFPLA
ncbi:hypothetical protein [Streptomyces sp. NPDC001401]